MIQQETWRSEKYQVLWSDFKEDSKNRFFFMYWIVLFNVGYILLIFSVQSAPIAQCSLIIALTILFMIFSAMIRPFKTFSSNFSHYFNLGSIVVVGALNLYLSIVENDPTFTNAEEQGLVIVIMIIINIAVNMLASLVEMIYNIYLYIKNYEKVNAERMKKKLKLQQLKGSRLFKQKGSDTSTLKLFHRSHIGKNLIRSNYHEDNPVQNLLPFQKRENQQLNFILEPYNDSIKKRKTIIFHQNPSKQNAAQSRRPTREKKSMENSHSEKAERLEKLQGLMTNAGELNYSKIQEELPPISNFDLIEMKKQGWEIAARREIIKETTEFAKKLMKKEPDDSPRRPTIKETTDNARKQAFKERTKSSMRVTIKELDGNPRRPAIKETTDNARRQTFIEPAEKQGRQTIKEIVEVPRRQRIFSRKQTIKEISMTQLQAQMNIPINFEWKLDAQMKEDTEGSLVEKSPTYVYRKPSQPADSDNPFIRIEARRKARTLEPGFLMK